MTANSSDLTNDSIWEPLTPEKYHAWYAESIQNPEEFWDKQAKRFLTWDKPWDQTCQWDFNEANIKWFLGAKLNVSVNCIDRHLPTRANQTAIIWEGDDPNRSSHITYQDLYEQVCRFANGLKSIGVKKGDRVCLYLPMIPDVAVAMLACARIGAIHTVVFGGFSPQALADRLENSECSVIITADEGVRGGKSVPLKHNVDLACEQYTNIKKVLVIKNTGTQIAMQSSRDLWMHELLADQPKTCDPEPMDSEDPLFILYTSGSTGKPKGVLHTTGGYLLYAAITHRYVFDYQDKEIFWCTADAGWITGHTYIVYGPLANGATTLIFEGVPTYPSPSRFWEVVDKHQVNIFYTAPTAIRALMAYGDKPVQESKRSSLRILGTVGEPINPEAWRWYSDVVGEGRCPVIDTWWQTETGGILLTPLPGIANTKPGAACMPFFGVKPEIFNEKGQPINANETGELVLTQSWPGQMRTVYGDHDRFKATYFSQYPGYYFTGDGAYCDTDGDYWITGRVDDVINVSGHRIGTAEIESALVQHPDVAEAAVVGIPHEVKGQSLYAFVTLVNDAEPSELLKKSLDDLIIKMIGKFAKPDALQWAPNLPKTRSGKIMRRLLRKIAQNDIHDLGDTSTLADPLVVQALVQGRLSNGKSASA